MTQKSLYDICNDLVKRHQVLKNGAAQYGQDDVIFNELELLTESMAVFESQMTEQRETALKEIIPHAQS